MSDPTSFLRDDYDDDDDDGGGGGGGGDDYESFHFLFFFQFFQSKDKVHRPRAINEQHEPDNKANKKHLQQLPLYITMSPT